MCSSGFTPLSLTALKFRRAEDESRNHAQVRFSAGIVELGVQHLRIVQLLLQRLCGRSRCFAPRKTCTARSSAAFGSAEESTLSSEATSLRAPRMRLPARAREKIRRFSSAPVLTHVSDLSE